MAQNTPRGTPARVLVILALLIGLVVVSAWRDALRREATSGVRFPTALGDAGIFRATPAPMELTQGGTTIRLAAGLRTVTLRDDQMFRVDSPMAAGLKFSLFTRTENPASQADPKLYARTAPDRYRRITASLAPAAPRSPSLLPPLVPFLDPDALPSPPRAIPLEAGTGETGESGKSAGLGEFAPP